MRLLVGVFTGDTLRDYFPKLGQANTWMPGLGPFQDNPGMERLWLLSGAGSWFLEIHCVACLMSKSNY